MEAPPLTNRTRLRERVGRPRKLAPSRMPALRSRQIPRWAHEVATPPKWKLLDMLETARLYPGAVLSDPCAQFFEQLSERAREECERGNVLAALELLDIAPGRLQRPAPWLLDALRRVFTERRYELFARLRRRVGKIESAQDEAREFAVGLLTRPRMGQTEPQRAGEPAVVQMVKSELSRAEAIRSIAQAEGTTAGAIEQSLHRQRVRRATATPRRPVGRTRGVPRRRRRGRRQNPRR